MKRYVISFHCPFAGWHRRLLALLSVPFQLARFIFTGKAHFLPLRDSDEAMSTTLNPKK